MKIRILKNEADYEAALAEIEKLMQSAKPDAERLELLALLVSDYEDKHYPIDLPDPVEAITFRMEQLGLDVPTKPLDLTKSPADQRLARWMD